jgi:hypothetical protein
MQTRLIACLGLASAAVLFACSDTAGPVGGGNVTVKFQVVSTQPSAVSTVAAAPAALALDGDNGSLTIDEIWLVVDEFKLERVEDACEELAEGQEDDDDCEEFEQEPFFVSVPLEGDGIGDVSAEVTPGTYEELKFETKAADDDGELLADIRENYFDDWPAEASMLVVGTFTPTDGDPVSFRAFFDAEVKVELEFPEGEPLVVQEGGDLSVTVFIDPAIWFVNDGTVDDLSMYDYDATNEVFKFEAKFEDGFTKIELDD